MSDRNRKDFLGIADRLDALAGDAALDDAQLRRQMQEALKPNRFPVTPAECKAFDEIEVLYRMYEGKQDDGAMRRRIAECATAIRRHLESDDPT
jgi:hypothetical protein